jgi:glutathionyl-hydroquinone reductase
MSTIQAFFSIDIFFYFISNNDCRLLTTVQVFDIMFDNSAPPSCLAHEITSFGNIELILKYLYLSEIFQNKDMDVNMKKICIVYFPK